MKISVIIAAGGVGKRFGGEIPKQYMKLDGVTVLDKALGAFSRFEEIIVAGVDTPAGPERQDTIKNALPKVTGDFVLVHDAARPFVSEDVINRVVNALLAGADAVVPCVAPKSTIRTKEKTLDRSSLYEVQTPQGFKTELLKEAYDKADFIGTDDASLVEALGKEITIVQGDYKNIKITIKEDMPVNIRIGNGYDVHKRVSGRPLMLGCTKIPYEQGLLGHSDADVLAHAIADSILGAAALGDIGKIFPDSGPGSDETLGMSGAEILKRTASLVRDKGYEISFIDSTVIAEKPKLSSFIMSMRRDTAKALGIDIENVSIKATTEEGLGERSRLGIAAMATCTLKG